MPQSWRIVKLAFAASAFDGEGARLNGGRWNTIGTPMVYTADSEALAIVELLVHLQSSDLLTSYRSIPTDFDHSLVEAVDLATLPSNWKDYPAPSATQQIGDQWVSEQRSVVLRVPSVVVPTGFSFLLNPAHPDFNRIVIGQTRVFSFDPRLK